MNSRRRMVHAPEPPYGQPIAVGAACLALKRRSLPIVLQRGRRLLAHTGDDHRRPRRRVSGEHPSPVWCGRPRWLRPPDACQQLAPWVSGIEASYSMPTTKLGGGNW